MRGSLVCLIAGVAATVLVAGCSSGTYGSSGSNTTTGAPAAAAPASTASSSASAGATAGGAKVATAAVSLGTILVDGQGRTLYLFEGDHGSSSSCAGSCASVWPPLTTTGAPQASGSVAAGSLSTTTRSDGTTQVTYYGHPLYYFAQDSKAGDVNGEGVHGFGADWYVVAPNGTKIDKS